jgi:signal transduction histidine kinase
MRQRPKPEKSKVQVPVAPKSPRDEDARVRDLEKRLAEALAREVTTSEILRVISQSQTDLQPVFEVIVRSAAQLCEATFAVMHRFDGQVVTFDAHYGMTEQEVAGSRDRFPLPTDRGTAVGRAILDRRTSHIHDIRLDAEYGVRAWQALFRTVLAVPLLREGVPVGAIGLWRREVQPFSEKQIKLVETFAAQAVIAIENVRLFKELEARNSALTESLEQQTATSEILRVISSSPTDAQPVFDAIAANAAHLCSANDAQLLRVEGEILRLVAAFGVSAMPSVRRLTRGHLVGRAVIDRKTIHVRDLEQALAEYPESTAAQYGVQSALAVPLLRDGVALGVIRISRTEIQPFTDKQIALLQTFADQAVIAIENVRLFKELEASNQEIAEKSRQVEVASQHKSEFLANMSHELRTPLNAVIGFSEVLTDRMFGELNEKQEEYLKDIHASGTHLLSLINDILDLSKVEAGRMELELTDFHLPTALDNALMLVRERAGRRSLALQMSVDERLGQIRADERKIRQVVLNLLSNAIKFTPEGGRIEVAAVSKDESVEVSVSDTGVGIAPEDQQAVFEEFRQVGTAEKKAEGTGLGLTLCRKFIELHGGRIWVKSQVGVGSTFTFTIPAGCGE